MIYDLELISDLCRELGLRTVLQTSDWVAIELEDGVVLDFSNHEQEEHSLIGFEDVGWHYHGDLTCSDRHGFCAELGYMDVLIGLTDGTVLLCERWYQGVLKDRSLVHRDFVDEFRFLEVDEEVRIRRPRLQEGTREPQTAE